MEKKIALSILNPTSYLVCLGIKTIENRTWSTDFRGRIYIHSCGEYSYESLIDYPYPVELGKQLDIIAAAVKKVDEDGDAAAFERLSAVEAAKRMGIYESSREGVDFADKIARYQDLLQAHYGVDLYKPDMDDDYNSICDKAVKEKGFFHRNMAIIGSVEIADIQRGVKSVWAQEGCYHWILKNPVLFDKPVINVKGRLRLFDVSNITLP